MQSKPMAHTRLVNRALTSINLAHNHILDLGAQALATHLPRYPNSIPKNKQKCILSP